MTTRASKARIATDGAGGCRIWVTTPPVDGGANKEVVELVAKNLSVAKSQVTIILGHRSRSKVLGIEGVSAEELDDWLEKISDRGENRPC